MREADGDRIPPENDRAENDCVVPEPGSDPTDGGPATKKMLMVK